MLWGGLLTGLGPRRGGGLRSWTIPDETQWPHFLCLAPRIPPDKRIFTTRHTPSCLFQDVDER